MRENISDFDAALLCAASRVTADRAAYADDHVVKRQQVFKFTGVNAVLREVGVSTSIGALSPCQPFSSALLTQINARFGSTRFGVATLASR